MTFTKEIIHINLPLVLLPFLQGELSAGLRGEIAKRQFLDAPEKQGSF